MVKRAVKSSRLVTVDTRPIAASAAIFSNATCAFAKPDVSVMSEISSIAELTTAIATFKLSSAAAASPDACAANTALEAVSSVTTESIVVALLRSTGSEPAATTTSTTALKAFESASAFDEPPAVSTSDKALAIETI